MIDRGRAKEGLDSTNKSPRVTGRSMFHAGRVAGAGATNGNQTPEVVIRNPKIDRGFLHFAPSSPEHPAFTHLEKLSSAVLS